MTIQGRVNPCSRELDGKVADLRPKTKLDNCKFYADYAQLIFKGVTGFFHALGAQL